MIEGKERAESTEVTSRLVSFDGPSGLRLVGYIDEGPEAAWNERFVVLAPRYGETKKNNLQMAYLLAANGFKVLRFDQSNHIGESDGTMDRFTLQGASEDILAAVSYVDAFFEPAEIILVAMSLSSRCGFRACATEPRISRFVSLVGMMDMNKTLQAIYNRDFFAELSSGADWRYVDILGFEIDGQSFHQSLIRSNMKCLEGTKLDAALVKVPVLHLYSEHDRWVDRQDVETVIGECEQGRLVLLPAVGHEINENSLTVRYASQQIVSFCLEGLESGSGELLQPSRAGMIQQNKQERVRLQEVMKFTDTESDFWGDYLGKFGIIEDAHYYVEYFRKMAELLGALKPADLVLDAGCGNGFYGLNIIRSLCFGSSSGAELPRPVHYCGIDLTKDGLNRSYSRHTEELMGLYRDHLNHVGQVGFSYRKIDFDSIQSGVVPLPFADGSVSKVCCSLVLSYLKEPVELVKEFRRVLKPGGVAVISSMKPGCDMTVLYHDYVVKDGPNETRDRDANLLLSAAGKIKLKKDTGIYRFFSEDELQHMAVAAGFSDMRSCRSFGNQANVIRVVK